MTQTQMQTQMHPLTSGIGTGASQYWCQRAEFHEPLNPLPYTVNPNVIFTQAANFMSAPYNLPSPTTYSWNVSVQRQIGATWILSSTYLGSRVQHLDIN